MIDELAQGLTPAIERTMVEFRVPGVACTVASRDATCSRHFGVTHAAHPLEITDETIFQVGSISKIVTATTVMRLVEQGVLDLDIPVRRWIPDLELADLVAARGVTLRQLMHHTGGWHGDYSADTGRGDDALERMRPLLAAAPQRTPLGSLYHYNNLGFVLAGLVIQRATGKPFETAVGELVLAPLWLDKTAYFPEDIIFERLAAGHIVGRRRTVSPYGRPRCRAPNGGVLSCTRDLVRFGRMHLGGGMAGEGNRVLERQSVAEMQKSAVPAGGDGMHRGLAWSVNRRYGPTLIEHGGATPGFQSGLWLLPELALVVVVLTNANTGGAVVNAVERELIRRLVERPLPVANGRIGSALFDDIRGVYGGGGALAISGTADKPILATYLGGLKDPEEHPIAATTTPDRFEIVAGRLTGVQFDLIRDRHIGGTTSRVRFLRYNGSRLFEPVTTAERIEHLGAIADHYPSLAERLAESATRTTAETSSSDRSTP